MDRSKFLAVMVGFCIPLTGSRMATAQGGDFITNLEVASQSSAFAGGWLVYTKKENVEDLNSDGDMQDSVLQILDLARGTFTNLGFAVQDRRDARKVTHGA